jgi:hypothetical protein
MHPSDNARRGCVQDRASIIATTIIAVLRDALGASEIRDQITTVLRDEFADIARITHDEIRESEAIADEMGDQRPHTCSKRDGGVPLPAARQEASNGARPKGRYTRSRCDSTMVERRTGLQHRDRDGRGVGSVRGRY